MSPRRLSRGWTIWLESVHGGYHYRLLRRPVTTDEPPRLTKRETAVLELASLGRSNKVIAQVLDISPSTVGVLLFRAAVKLRAPSRSELLRAYGALKAAGERADK
jgi:DNA-binding NarL/FixJ family response regulator